MFITDSHPISRRSAVFEVGDNGGWLYLTAPDDTRPQKDVLAFALGPLATIEVAMREVENGRPPPLAAKFASDHAVISHVSESEFSFGWSSNGESVAILRAGDPIAMIVEAESRGYSRSLGLSGPYGMPWSKEIFTAAFA